MIANTTSACWAETLAHPEIIDEEWEHYKMLLAGDRIDRMRPQRVHVEQLHAQYLLEQDNLRKAEQAREQAKLEVLRQRESAKIAQKIQAEKFRQRTSRMNNEKHEKKAASAPSQGCRARRRQRQEKEQKAAQEYQARIARMEAAAQEADLPVVVEEPEVEEEEDEIDLTLYMHVEETPETIPETPAPAPEPVQDEWVQVTKTKKNKKPEKKSRKPVQKPLFAADPQLQFVKPCRREDCSNKKCNFKHIGEKAKGYRERLGYCRFDKRCRNAKYDLAQQQYINTGRSVCMSSHPDESLMNFLERIKARFQ